MPSLSPQRNELLLVYGFSFQTIFDTSTYIKTCSIIFVCFNLFKKYHTVCIWPSSFSIVLRSTSFLLTAVQYSIVWKYLMFFIYFPLDRHLQVFFIQRELRVREVTGLARYMFLPNWNEKPRLRWGADEFLNSCLSRLIDDSLSLDSFIAVYSI